MTGARKRGLTTEAQRHGGSGEKRMKSGKGDQDEESWEELEWGKEWKRERKLGRLARAAERGVRAVMPESFAVRWSSPVSLQLG